MTLELPVHAALPGAGALAPLHGADRHPREAVLLLTGPCHEQDRPLRKIGLDGLRNLGYLLGSTGAGSYGAPQELLVPAVTPPAAAMRPPPGTPAASTTTWWSPTR
ncbi:hypothetical protein [Nonomuraea sp. NPDC050783]|uniref:hypothetical protein n=1 Tax=Nonomuraea sp. NPDC050783 TaxID=3154634 RepID=UPI003466798F